MTSKKNHPGTVLCRAALMFLLTIAPSIGWGQTNVPTPAPLPPAAQEALNKGIIAAKVPDYPLAIRFFDAARKAAPQATVIFLNLGLAESRIPGRELRAIAWFGAYLTAFPTAPNAQAIKEQMDALDVKSQSNISRLIKSAQDAASQISDSDQPFRLIRIVTLWQNSGDTAAALRAANLIQDVDFQGIALRNVAGNQAWSGDIAGAQKTAELIRSALFKSETLINVARAKIYAGDLAGANNTLASALKSVELIDPKKAFGITSGAWMKSERQSLIATEQAAAGDIAGAQKTADLIPNTSYFHRTIALQDIARAQMKAGDMVGAQVSLVSAKKAADLIEYEDHKKVAQTGIAQVTAAIANAPDAIRQPTPIAQPDIQPALVVSDWLKKLDDDDNKSDCPLNTGPFLDLAGHLKSLPNSDSAGQVSWYLLGTAEKIVGAQNVIARMLKPPSP